MGCQSSKAAKASAATPGPRTLLEDAGGKKAVAEQALTPSATEHSDAQTPLPGPSTAAEPPSNQVSFIRTVSGGVSPAATRVDSAPSTHVDSQPSHASIGMLRTHRTLCTPNKDLDIMVVDFSSHDSTVGSFLGRNCKEMRWKVMYDPDADPIDIKVHVQEHSLHSNEVEIQCNGQPIFHGAGSHAKAKMTEDFRYQWPFRGAIQGINEPNLFEVRPAHSALVYPDRWFPAVITGQREDGNFEVCAREPNGTGGITEVKYPAVHKDNLREATSLKPIAVPENLLTLEVLKHQPLDAKLSLTNGELVTHHFGRPSPPVGGTHQKSEVALKVTKDRSEVIANVGHQVLSHFVSGEVQAKTSEVERLRHSWTVQVGPFAEHTVTIEKKHTLGKIHTLLVDGEVLVESSAADIGCEGDEWQCKFRFIGERVLDFEVFRTNADGCALNETGHVKDRRRYVHECNVTVPNDWDFSSARLIIDGVPFTALPVEAHRYEEPSLTLAPLALLHTYDISTPHIVDRTAPSNMMMLANQVLVKANSGTKTAGGFFAGWCDCSSISCSSIIDSSAAKHA